MLLLTVVHLVTRAVFVPLIATGYLLAVQSTLRQLTGELGVRILFLLEMTVARFLFLPNLVNVSNIFAKSVTRSVCGNGWLLSGWRAFGRKTMKALQVCQNIVALKNFWNILVPGALLFCIHFLIVFNCISLEIWGENVDYCFTGEFILFLLIFRIYYLFCLLHFKFYQKNYIN
mgnify:CR=1 FL=1